MNINYLGNIVNVMPPGKKRRKRSLRNVTATCEAESRSTPGSNMLSDASLISVKLIQVRIRNLKKNLNSGTTEPFLDLVGRNRIFEVTNQ